MQSVTEIPDVSETLRIFKDPVWDVVRLDQLMCRIIDTPQFQRLRYLKQLGTSYFVFPGASHNRFEHGIGTAHLARTLVTHLRDRQPSLGIDDRDVQCVTIAGLCHDLGHGPFSHVFDNHFIPRAKGPRPDGSVWCHEEASEMMLDALVRDPDNEIDLPQDRVDFIKDLIRGEPRLTLRHQPPEKPFLFEIVANKRNGIDVDKWDYIARDTRAIGETCTLVASRLIEAARVVGDTIAYNYKDAQSVHELFYSRYSLHKRIYSHKAAKAIEYMIVEALLAAEPVYHLAEAIDDPQKYLHVTDSLIEDIERRDDPRLEKSKQIIKDLRRRHIPKRVEEKCLHWRYKDLWKSKLTPKRIAEASVELCEQKRKEPTRSTPLLGGLEAVTEEHEMDHSAKSSHVEGIGGPLLPPVDLAEASSQSATTEAETVVDDEPLTEDDIIVDFSILHFGMKDKDPLDLVAFYGKESPNSIGIVRRDQQGYLRPEQFQELIVRIYARDERKRYLVQAACRKVMETLPEDFEESAPQELVPDATMHDIEEPATPTADHYRSNSGSFVGAEHSPSVSPKNATRARGRSVSSTPFANAPNTFTTIRPTPKLARKRKADSSESLTAGDGSPGRERKKRA